MGIIMLSECTYEEHSGLTFLLFKMMWEWGEWLMPKNKQNRLKTATSHNST